MLWMILLCASYVLATPLYGWNRTNHDYLLDPFPRAHHDGMFITNACGGGYRSQGEVYGFACPHMMMFSEDMILASEMDGLDSEFWYATAGSSRDADCGKCFHVRLGENERANATDGTSHRPKTDLVVQVINSGGDVGFRQFDLFVGAGGFGVYTACNIDCSTTHCNGGPCHASLYNGTFSAWTHADDLGSSVNACYNGGVKWFPPYNNTALTRACRALTATTGDDTFKNEQLFRSCYFSNLYGYHQNFGSYRSRRVQCPRALYMLTGLRRADDNDFDLPMHGVPNERMTESCNDSACITTMCDCCKPSCAWSDKGQPDKEWSAVRTCDQFGFPF